ncbi:MAG: acireductone synthase [Luteibaculum sp.]
MSIRHILCDIEGTTTKISFVSDVLFPYFVQNLENEWDSLSDWEEFDLAIAEIEKDSKARSKKEYIKQLKEWVSLDVKQTGLKRLQGKVWEKGYQKGELKAHLYPDVPEAFKFWKKNKLTINIYSSGSVQAQKLLFKHTEYGDLSHNITSYFDTKVGHKREVNSYREILKQLAVQPENILFLSDIEEELNAAQKEKKRNSLVPSM